MPLPAAFAQTAPTYCVNNLGGFGCQFANVRIPGTAFNAYTGGYCQVGRDANGSQHNAYPVADGYTATLVPGTTYQLVARFNVATSASLWLDANGNGTFEASEWTLISSSTPGNGTEVTVSFTVPATARPGQTGLRLRTSNPALGAADACANAGYNGDTRDFTVSIAPAGSATAAPHCTPTYQAANPGPYNSIEEVLLAGTTLHNITGTPLAPYYSYPASGFTTGRVERGQSYSLYTYLVSSFYSPRVGVWVDWNQNQQFEASEYQAVTDTPPTSGVSYYATRLVVPATAALGTTRLRIRSREIATAITVADACTTFASGETEDYPITVTAAATVPLPTYNPAPVWSAARNDGASTSDDMSALAVDSTSGATYAVGSFQTSVRFGTLTATSGAGRDAFYLSKYDASGAPQWVRSTDLDGPSTYSTAYAYAGAVDPQGNVYVTGTLSGTARFGTGVSLTNPTAGGTFLVKYNAAGTALWAQSVTSGSGAGGTEFTIRGLAVDAQGNACLAGAVYYS